LVVSLWKGRSINLRGEKKVAHLPEEMIWGKYLSAKKTVASRRSKGGRSFTIQRGKKEMWETTGNGEQDRLRQGGGRTTKLRKGRSRDCMFVRKEGRNTSKKPR